MFADRVDKLTGGLLELTKRRNVQFIHARGQFADSRTINLDWRGKDKGPAQLHADKIILAAGSLPAIPPSMRLDDPRVMDSTGALNLPDIPKRLCIIGGGYIGLESGTYYQALGSEVTVIELTSGLLEPKVARWVFPLVATFFLFIVVSNLMGLLPGVGSIGWGHASGAPLGVEHADKPLFRPPTADANMTVAMALVFFVMSTFWAFRYNGPIGLVKHIFGVKGGMTGWIVIPMALIFIFIGLIEVISICIRPVALAMRLYGNIYGGESVLTIMLTNSPLGLGALPFYFLELLVAVVQALVFTLLSIAFIGTLCSHTEDEGHGKEAHH